MHIRKSSAENAPAMLPSTVRDPFGHLMDDGPTARWPQSPERWQKFMHDVGHFDDRGDTQKVKKILTGQKEFDK